MSKFSDSRDANGIGYLILQDHGYKSKGVPDHGRGGLVGVRVIGRNDNEGQDGKWNENEYARGMIGGAVFWEREKENAGAFQFGWASIVADEGVSEQRKNSRGLIPRGAGGRSFDRRQAAGEIVPGQRKPSTVPDTARAPGAGGEGGQKADPVADPIKAAQDKLKGQGTGYKYKGVVYGGGTVPIKVGIFGFNDPNLIGANGGPFGINVPPLNIVGVNPQFKIGGAFGIGVAPWNINIVGAAAHRDIIVKKAKGDDEDNRIFYNLGFDSVTASEIPLNVFPASRTWSPDGRYKKVEPRSPFGWPDFPRGYAIYTVHSSSEDSQDELALSVDPRLVAVNKGSPFTVGTIVTDTTGDGAIDLNLGARLHSMMRVVPSPTAFNGVLKKNQQNWISWNIGPSGRWDTHGGLVTDRSQGGGSSRASRSGRPSSAHALASVSYGGPFDVGGPGDLHQWGVDADGIPINALHVSTDAKVKVRGSNTYDGPIHFEYDWPDPGELDYPIHCHWGFDLVDGRWKIWTTSKFTSEPPYRPTPVTPPTTPPTHTPPPVITPPEPKVHGDPEPRNVKRINMTHMETRFPAISFRPQRMVTGTPDLRYTTGAEPDSLARAALEDPTVARLEAWGTQTGLAGGPYLSGSGAWGYTHRPGQAPYLGGTASGGLLLTSPEYGMEAIDNALVPAGFATSTVYIATPPGNYFGAGLPELSTGGMKTAYSWGSDGGGGLTWRSHDSAGAVTTRFTMDSAGLHDFNDHGEIYIGDGGVAQTGIDTTPVVMTGFDTDGVSNNVTPDHTADTLTIGRTGTYRVEFQLAGVGSSGVDFNFHPYVDGVKQEQGTHRQFTAVNGSCNFRATLSLTAAQVLDVRVATDSGSNKSITPVDMQFSAERIR